MGFANLALLGIGAALLSVPLLLLLINRKRQVIPWAAYYWMKLALQKKKKRVRVTEWLKLLSKLLLILAIALFLARPLFGFGEQGVTLVVVDTSLSMSTTNGAGTRLDLARERAASIIRDSSESIGLASFDGRLELLALPGAEAGGIVRLAQAIPPGGGSGHARDLVDALLSLEDLSAYNRVVLISDFQRQGYGDGALLQELDERLPKGTGVVLVPVDERERLGNLAVLDWRLAGEGLHRARQNTVEVRVQNLGPDPVEQVPLTLRVDGVDTDRAFVSLEPDASKWLSLGFPLPDGEAHELTVSLPPDDYTLDDALHIALAPIAARRVLAVVPEPAADAHFGMDTFVRSALLAVGSTDAWQYISVSPALALHEDLGGYDLVLLFDQPLGPGDPLVTPLLAYLESGGGVISFAGFDSSPEQWAPFGQSRPERWEGSGTPDPARLAGGYLAFLGADGKGAELIHLSRALVLGGTPPAEGRLYLHGEGQALDAPVIRALPVGAGRLVCVGFLPIPGHTDLFYNPNFVQFTQRMAWEAMGQAPGRGPVGEAVTTLQPPDFNPSRRYTWSRDGDAPQALALREGDGPMAAGLDLQAPAADGFYTVYADDEPVLRLGFNPSRDDSAITPTGEALRGLAGGRVRVLDAGGAGSRGVQREPVWLATLLLLAALALEFYAHLGRRT